MIKVVLLFYRQSRQKERIFARTLPTDRLQLMRGLCQYTQAAHQNTHMENNYFSLIPKSASLNVASSDGASLTQHTIQPPGLIWPLLQMVRSIRAHISKAWCYCIRNQRQCACSVAVPHLQRWSQVCHRNQYHDGCRYVATNCYDFPITPFLVLSSAKQAADYQRPHLFRSQQQHPLSLQRRGHVSRRNDKELLRRSQHSCCRAPGGCRPRGLTAWPPHRGCRYTDTAQSMVVCRPLGRACRQTLAPHGSRAMPWVPSRRSWCPSAFLELSTCRARAQPAPRLHASLVPSITAGLLAASQMHFSLSDWPLIQGYTDGKVIKGGWDGVGIITYKSFNQTCREKRLKKAAILKTLRYGLFGVAVVENAADIYSCHDGQFNTRRKYCTVTLSPDAFIGPFYPQLTNSALLLYLVLAIALNIDKYLNGDSFPGNFSFWKPKIALFGCHMGPITH